MKPKFAKAYYKNYTAKGKILMAVVSAVLFAGLQFLSYGPLVILTSGEINLAMAIPPIAGILSGWFGVIGTTIGAIAGTLYIVITAGSLSAFAGYIPQIIGDALYAIFAYMMWHRLSSHEEALYRLSNFSRVLHLMLSVLVGALPCVLISNLTFLFPSGAGLTVAGVFYYLRHDFFVAVDMALIFGMPLYIFITGMVRGVRDKSAGKQELHNIEKIILVFGLIEIIFFVLCLLRGVALYGNVMEAILYNVDSLKIAAIGENILLAMMLYICLYAKNRDSIIRAIAKASLVLAVAFLAFGIYAVATRHLFNLSIITALNIVANGSAIFVCMVLIIACINDATKLTKQTEFFMIMLINVLFSAVASTLYVVSLGAGLDDTLVQYFSTLESIFNAILYIFIWMYSSVTLDVPKKRTRRQGFAVIPMSCIYCIASVLQIFNPTWVLLAASVWLATAVIYVVNIIKHRSTAYETISLLCLTLLGLIFDLPNLVYGDLYFSYIGLMAGLIFCFSDIYLERSRIMGDTQKDLDLASNIQISMLPTDFTIDEFDTIDLFASMRAAKDIGGDFYDFLRSDRNHLVFVIADVSGKGPSGAMMMMRAITSIRNFAVAGLSLEKTMEMASNNINEHNDAMLFVTAWMGKLNLENGELEFINAGHNPPIIRHQDGSTTEVKSKPDLIMGFFPDAHYRSQMIQLQEGDTLYLYTDGVTEAYNDQNEQFGMNRLEKSISKSYPSVQDLCVNIVKDVDNFVGLVEQFDDMTMLAVKYIKANDHLTNNYDAASAVSEEIEDITVSDNQTQGLAGIQFEEYQNTEPLTIEII